jgi:hypothetical protein
VQTILDCDRSFRRESRDMLIESARVKPIVLYFNFIGIELSFFLRLSRNLVALVIPGDGIVKESTPMANIESSAAVARQDLSQGLRLDRTSRHSE